MSQTGSPNVRQILSAITEYGNDVTFASEPGHRSGSALALLRIAMGATQELHRIWLDHPGLYDDVEECFREVAPTLSFWPIPFNEVTNLEPYKKLRIGHDRLDSKSPKRRTGSTVFSHYAQILVSRVEYFRAESRARRLGKKWSGLVAHTAEKESVERILAFAKLVNGTNPPSPWMALHTHKPKSMEEIEALPDFSAKTTKVWSEATKKFFKDAISRCEEIQDLATKINDRGVVYDSQMRSQIVERIGRAVTALARKHDL